MVSTEVRKSKIKGPTFIGRSLEFGAWADGYGAFETPALAGRNGTRIVGENKAASPCMQSMKSAPKQPSKPQVRLLEVLMRPRQYAISGYCLCNGDSLSLQYRSPPVYGR